MGLIISSRVKRLKKARDTDGLIGILRDTQCSPKERRAAAVALGETRNVRAVGPLIGALRDIEVRGLAAEALGRIGEVRAVGPLADLMHTTQNPRVQKSAEMAIAVLFARDEAGCRRVLKSAESDLKRRAERFAQRQRERVESWQDCPLCGRPLAASIPHAVFCSFCDRYITDPNWVPKVSIDAQPKDSLIGAQMGAFTAAFMIELGYPYMAGGSPLFTTDLVWRLDQEAQAAGQPVFLDAPLLRMAWSGSLETQTR